jgi:type II secretory pathway predicted ATPase ExeA
LREKPFSLSCDPRFFFNHSSQRPVFDALIAGIHRREGILALTGEVGTGKTTLCRAVLEALNRRTFAAFVPDPFLSREDLLKTLLVNFGVLSIEEIRSGRLQGATRTDLSYPLYEFLVSLQPLHAFAVVMIDEAQNLPSRLLEEIRILADMEDGQKLLQVVLVGQPELRFAFSKPEMRQLRQRLSVQCELLSLSRKDIGPYISHRLLVAGNNNRILFSDSATDRIWSASDGIARIVNLICDGALARAALERTSQISTDHVDRAIVQLRLHDTQPLSVQGSDPAWVADESRAVTPGPASGLKSLSAESTDHGSPSQDYGARDADLDLEAFKSEKSLTLIDVVASRRRQLLGLAVGIFGLTLGALGYVGLMPTVPTGNVTVPTSFQRELSQPDLPPPVPLVTVETSQEQLADSSSSPSIESQTRSMEHTTFAIEMATLETPGGAERAIRELAAAGYPAFTQELILSSGRSVQAVFLGPYAEIAEAQRDLELARRIRGYTIGRIVQIETTP